MKEAQRDKRKRESFWKYILIHLNFIFYDVMIPKIPFRVSGQRHLLFSSPCAIPHLSLVSHLPFPLSPHSLPRHCSFPVHVTHFSPWTSLLTFPVPQVWGWSLLTCSIYLEGKPRIREVSCRLLCLFWVMPQSNIDCHSWVRAGVGAGESLQWSLTTLHSGQKALPSN